LDGEGEKAAERSVLADLSEESPFFLIIVAETQIIFYDYIKADWKAIDTVQTFGKPVTSMVILPNAPLLAFGCTTPSLFLLFLHSGFHFFVLVFFWIYFSFRLYFFR